MDKAVFDPRLTLELPDLGDSVRTVKLDTRQVISPHFGGVGFHAFHHYFPVSQEEMDEVIYKRWRELQPSFARINHHLAWDQAGLDRVADHLLRMKETGTELYLATWDPPKTKPGEERAAYARKVVDQLEYLRHKGVSNLRYYCMTNELSLDGWGSLAGDMPTFKDYHQALYNELKSRKLDIGLLASDASPVEYWETIEWAAQNMDEITAVYGGHHYINNYALDDPAFYTWFLGKLRWGVDLAKAKKKDFVLGEFGTRQDGRTIEGVKRDCCIYFDTPQEPMVSIQLADAVIAALNAGVYSMGYWTFMDCPDEGFGAHYINKWGLFKDSGEDRSTRSLYYGYGLLSRYFRGPSTVYRVEANDPLLRVAALQHHDKGTWSIAVVNRNPKKVSVDLTLAGKPIKGTFRKYVYDPAHVPQHPFGDLPGPEGKAALKDSHLTDTVGPNTLTVYTTAYDDRPPAPVKGLKVERKAESRDRLTWQASTEADLCYYRVFRSDSAGFTPSTANQIGSTIATRFTAPPGNGHYRVLAIDRSGNVSAQGNERQ